MPWYSGNGSGGGGDLPTPVTADSVLVGDSGGAAAWDTTPEMSGYTATGTGLNAITWGTGAGYVAGSGIHGQSHIVGDAVADEDDSEWGISYSLDCQGPYTAPREKFAIVGISRNAVNDAVNYAANGGIYGRAVISANNTNAHVWGGIFEIWGTNATSGGQMLGVEIGLHSYEAGGAIDTATAKFALWLRNNMPLGSARATAMIANTNDTAAWQYGYMLRQVTDSFIRIRTPAGAAGTTVGIDMGTNSANWLAAMIIPNNAPIQAVNAAASANRNLISLNADDDVVLGSSAAPQVLIGKTTAVITAPNVLEIEGASGSTGNSLIWVGSATGSRAHFLHLRNGAASHYMFIAGTTNDFLTGTAAGNAGWKVVSGSQSFHIGGTTKVVSVTTANELGFHAATPIAKPAVSGSRSGNAALASLLTTLATYGLITDSSSA